MDARVRTVVCGTGFIGLAHVEALRRIGVDVVGLVGSSPDRAQPKADATFVPRVYDDLAAVLDDPDVDVVHIASPNNVHASQASSVLAAGKHVVCEKPLGVDSSETGALAAQAEESGLINAVCFNVRYYPLCRQLSSMVAAGELGAPRFITGSYLQDWMLWDTDWNWRLQPEAGGPLRAVADIGSHWLDLAAYVTGRRVVEVLADLHTFIPVRRRPAGPVETFASTDEDVELVEQPVTSDDAAGILLRFEDDARGSVVISQVAAGRKNALHIEVDGADAAAAWHSESPDRLWLGHRGRLNEELRRDPTLLEDDAASIAALPGGHVEGFADTFRALFSEVYADVRRGRRSARPSYPTFADGHDIVLVTEAVARSAAEDRWITVGR